MWGQRCIEILLVTVVDYYYTRYDTTHCVFVNAVKAYVFYTYRLVRFENFENVYSRRRIGTEIHKSGKRPGKKKKKNTVRIMFDFNFRRFTALGRISLPVGNYRCFRLAATVHAESFGWQK